MQPKKVILSTRNPSKAEQIRAVFAGSPISIVSLDEADIEGQAIEDGNTLEENALKKAMFVHEQKLEAWAMADDTGIFIDALDGKPGVHTADWHGENKETEQITHWVLDQLKNVDNRSATFRTVVAVVTLEGEHHFFTGEVRGTIFKTPQGKIEPHMPYGSIFIPDGIDKTFAQMSLEEKNTFSHRGKAFCQARTFLETLL